MSRLYELVPTSEDVVVYNEKSGHIQVLTPEGAVFDRPDTSDVRNMSIAFGLLLTSNEWRNATEEEIAEWLAHPPVPMMALNWVIPKPKPRPKLTVINGSKGYYFDHEAEDTERMINTLTTEPSEEAKAFYDSLKSDDKEIT